MSFPVFSKRHFPLKRQGKLGKQQSILNRYVLSVPLLSVATRFTQVQQVSIRLHSEFVTDMSWTNCHHVNTKFSDNLLLLSIQTFTISQHKSCKSNLVHVP